MAQKAGNAPTATEVAAAKKAKKRALLIKLAPQRVNKVLITVRKIRNLTSYYPTHAEIDKILTALETEFKALVAHYTRYKEKGETSTPAVEPFSF